VLEEVVREDANGAWMTDSRPGAALNFSHPAGLEHETGDHPERPASIEASDAELERRG
jgi:hypothetical protein